MFYTKACAILIYYFFMFIALFFVVGVIFLSLCHTLRYV
ncbi:unnamed protein product [Arabidopsis halleri]